MRKECPFYQGKCQYLSLRQNLEEEYKSTTAIKPKIIAIEGIVGAGKTTLTEYMKEQGLTNGIVPEYTVIAGKDNLPIFSPDQETLEKSTCFYAGVELRRQKQLIDLSKKNKTILTDRSDLSILSFNYAAEKRYSLSGLFDPTYNCLDNIIFIAPDIYIYLDIPFSTSINRMKARGSFKESVFTDKDFVNFTITGYKSLLENRNHITVDGSLPISRISREVQKLI